MIKRLIEYLIIKRKIKYIQYENSLKSNSARNCINYSTLKTTSIKISTIFTFYKKKKRISYEKKKFHMKKKDFISLFCYSTLIYSRFEFIEYRIKRILF